VGEIAARYHQRLVVGHLAQLGCHGGEGLLVAVADDDGHELELAKSALKEWELDLERVLAAVDRRAAVEELGCEEQTAGVPVERDVAERGLVGVHLQDRAAGEARAAVVDREDDDPLVALALRHRVGHAGAPARIGVAGVRRDQPHRLALYPLGLPGTHFQEVVHLLGEPLRILGVELPGDHRVSHPARRLAARGPRQGRNEDDPPDQPL